MKRFISIVLASAFIVSASYASDREDDVSRTHKAAEIFKEIMTTPDKGIPEATA